ncbi:MAG: hypothetical protein HY710_03880 [Candidatus Latescibacteria bacterium]|nr:hypothetical protein [Candidatus Latescibacterota bacterium]
MRSWPVGMVVALVLIGCLSPGWAASDEKPDNSRLSDRPIPLQTKNFPKRPRLLLELGERFLSTGPLGRGVTIPTGATWQPALWVFGTYRTGVQSFDNGPTLAEWTNRMDVFVNLRLSGTERILLGLRPFNDRGDVGYIFRPTRNDGWQHNFTSQIQTLFFEGDIGELFPKLDSYDRRPFDIGFAVGRQALVFQDGMLMNDNMDAVGLTRNSLRPWGVTNIRITGLYGWNQINRTDTIEDRSAQLIGLFTETDTRASTINVDLAYVLAKATTGDAFYAGVSGTQRLGEINTTFRVNASIPIDRQTVVASRGTLLSSEFSWTPPRTRNLLYFNTFWAIQSYSLVARDPGVDGPLGRIGILFAAAGMGQYGAALSSQAQDAVGGSLGYQMLFTKTRRRQLILEVSGRKDTNRIDAGAAAIGMRYQHAVGRRMLLQLDGFAATQQRRDTAYGGRFETQVKF